MISRRRTIAGHASVSGIGLHLGRPCTLTFRPGSAGTGIVFVRTDRPGSPAIRADATTAVFAERRTQLGDGADALHTVEHVLAAVAGLGFTDVLIEMDGPEPPVLDGSALPFVDALQQCGVVLQSGAVTPLVVTEAVRITDGESIYEASPGSALELDVDIEFPHALIGRQRGCWTVTTESFARDIAPARTFGFLSEVEHLHAKGLALGASTANTVALTDSGLADGIALRWPDEFVRHKTLDLVGDLALAGRPIRGHIRAHKPSHRGTIAFVRTLLTRFGREDRVIGIEELMKILPHRYPFLLVDRVLEMEPQKRIVGIKNVTINEPFFQGHFPGDPIMPGVLIVEAMAQVGGLLLMGTVDDPGSKVVYFMSIDTIKFRRPVRPGDQLRLELELTQIRGNVCRMTGVAKVDGKVVCEASEMAAMVRSK